MTDSPERAAAREAVSKAIAEYVRVAAKEHDEDGDVVVMGWAACAEVNSVRLLEHDSARIVPIVQDGQNLGMSIGLYRSGERSFL